MVDVEPERRLADPGVPAALDWAGRVCAAKGSRLEVWSGVDSVVLRNVRFLAAGRRANLRRPRSSRLLRLSGQEMSIAETEEASGAFAARLLPALRPGQPP